MDQLCTGRRCGTGKIIFFTQQHRQTATGGVSRDTRTINATTDNQQINI
jgi:hypothetical protein